MILSTFRNVLNEKRFPEMWFAQTCVKIVKLGSIVKLINLVKLMKIVKLVKRVKIVKE